LGAAGGDDASACCDSQQAGFLEDARDFAKNRQPLFRRALSTQIVRASTLKL
jgi:hypothetical protein